MSPRKIRKQKLDKTGYNQHNLSGKSRKLACSQNFFPDIGPVDILVVKTMVVAIFCAYYGLQILQSGLRLKIDKLSQTTFLQGVCLKRLLALLSTNAITFYGLRESRKNYSL